VRYTDRLDAAGALRSVGSKGDSFDNAAAESLIGLYKTELIRRRGPLRQPITPPVLAIGPRRFLDPGPGSTASWLHGHVLRGRDLRTAGTRAQIPSDALPRGRQHGGVILDLELPAVLPMRSPPSPQPQRLPRSRVQQRPHHGDQLTAPPGIHPGHRVAGLGVANVIRSGVASTTATTGSAPPQPRHPDLRSPHARGHRRRPSPARSGVGLTPPA
jgi:hypothetical protein